MSRKLLSIIMVLVLVGSILAGCTSEQGTDTPGAADKTADTKLEGKVIVDGSGTVYPLMANIAEEYMANVQPGVSVQVGRAGSSAGFKKFIPGEINFSDASRKIKDQEAADAKANGVEFLEFKVALDGLTMVINKENTWAKEMKKEEIINMYLSGKYKADDKVLWSDIRADWPAEEIKFYGPNENHGTYEFFHETILEKKDMVTTVNLQQEYSTLVDLVSK
ncbi:MAG: phoX, partial [Clostridia bacterium]|nr:phoX [Clostridia bacterium]